MSFASFMFGEKCERCDERNHTLFSFEGKQSCNGCKKEILWERKRTNAMAGDTVVDCPLCKVKMEKKFLFDDELAIRDKCPTCKGVFLSSDEVNAIKEHNYNKGYNSGESNGRSTGTINGFVIGSIIN